MLVLSLILFFIGMIFIFSVKLSIMLKGYPYSCGTEVMTNAENKFYKAGYILALTGIFLMFILGVIAKYNS